MRTLTFIGVAAVVAHLLAFLPVGHLMQAAAVFLLTGFLPGLLFVQALVGRSAAPPAPVERILYGLGMGYAIQVAVMLWLSYLPGVVPLWETFLVFDLVLLLLAVWVYLQNRRAQPVARTTPVFPDGERARLTAGWIVTGAVVLVAVGLFLRLTNLGYAEYQGDEARAALRAAAILQGYEDVLMLHKKGPTEILLPTIIYSMADHLTEATARFPFTLANLAGLFAVWLLGWRLFNPLAGWLAAMLLAVDGYFIGFSRIVQYQSVVFFTSALVVLIVYRLYRQPVAITRYLIIASLLLATGLLSHYEAALVVLPAGFLLVALVWRVRRTGRPADAAAGELRLDTGRQWAQFLGKIVLGAAPGVVLLLSFYVPFVLHPHFQATYVYLTDRRIGGSFPYNNLADFFLRTTVYNTTYYVLLLVVLSLAAVTLAYRRGLGPRWGAGMGLVATAVMALTFWNPQWLLVGETDLIVLPFLVILGGLVLLPRISVEERTLWLWFGAVMVLAFFFTEKPRTHVYTFFTPWMLLLGWVASQGWSLLRERLGGRPALVAGAGVTGALVLLFGSYGYWYFVHNQPEVLRTWFDWHPAGYWVPYQEPDDKALFGFPLSNGWKVVGALYEQGVISGDYETNEKEAWVPAWYTRGQYRCGRTAEWFFEIDNLEPWNNSDQLKMEHYLRQGFEKWGIVQVNGVDRMVIYHMTGNHVDAPTETPTDHIPRFRLEEFEYVFDREAVPNFPLTYPAINPAIANPLQVNFDNQIWLEGYAIEMPEPLRQGDTIRLTLYWRAQQPIGESYKVFNQAFFGDGQVVAQRDGYPVCETRETWRWDPGELITDVYDIPVMEDAPDGLYPLYTGFYLEETFERLPVVDDAGNEISTQVHLTDIRIGEE